MSGFVWVAPPRPDGRGTLCAAELPGACRGGAGSDADGVPPLSESLVCSLHEALRRVRNPRAGNRRFHIGAMPALHAEMRVRRSTVIR